MAETSGLRHACLSIHADIVDSTLFCSSLMDMQETGKARQDKAGKPKRDMANPEGTYLSTRLDPTLSLCQGPETKAIVIDHRPADDDESALLGFENR